MIVSMQYPYNAADADRYPSAASRDRLMVVSNGVTTRRRAPTILPEIAVNVKIMIAHSIYTILRDIGRDLQALIIIVAMTIPNGST